MLPDYLIYAPLIMVFLLEVLAVAVLVAYFSFLKKFQRVDDAYRKIKKEAQKHENEVLEEARREGAKIIAQSQQKAEAMITHAVDLSNRYAQEFGQELSKVSKEQMSVYKQVLEQSRKETAEMLKQVAEETRTLSVKEVENLKLRLVEQAQQSQTALSAGIASAFTKAEGEIDAYKQERIRFIEAHVVEMMEEVARQALPRQMTLQQQEEVIVAALEEAYKERLFGVDPQKTDKTSNIRR
jgi:hypothetical protein